MPKSSSVGGEVEVKVAAPPPGLGFAGLGRRFFGQIPRNIPTQTKLPKGDTDSIMADKHTTQRHEQGDQHTQLAKDERGMGGNATQQLPNTDPTHHSNQIIGQIKIGIR